MGIIPTPETHPGGISGAAFARAVAAGGSPEMWPGFWPTISNGTTPIAISMDRAFKITKVTTDCISGSCTFEVRIGSTALGGGSNAVSTTRQTKSHSTSNEGAVGDDINIVITSNSSCVGLSFNITVEYPIEEP